jgi:hypothetical protein
VLRVWLKLRDWASKPQRYDFISTPLADRPALLKEAVGGGSIPHGYMHDLEQAAAASTRLTMSVDAALDKATVTVAAGSGGGTTPLGKGGGGEGPPGRVVVNGKEFDLVILATGTSLDMASSPLHASLVAGFPCDFVGSLPVLDESLQWNPDERIFVMGALAGAQLGPSATLAFMHACIQAFVHPCIHTSSLR